VAASPTTLPSPPLPAPSAPASGIVAMNAGLLQLAGTTTNDVSQSK
jgi:hypothetical protein